MKISTVRAGKNSAFSDILVVGALCVLWEVIANIIGQEIYLPSFSQTMKALFSLMETKVFYVSIALSVLRVCGGFALSLVLGCILGLLAAFSPLFSKLLSPIMNIIRATPVASFILLFLIWMNSSVAAVAICLIMLTPIFYENMFLGVSEINSDLTAMCAIFEMSFWKYLTKVVLPSTRPYVASAMLTALGFAYKTVVSAEVISQPKFGIGTMLFESKLYLETANLFAYTICVVFLSYLFEQLLKKHAAKTREMKNENN